jgi:hypothetical protein
MSVVTAYSPTHIAIDALSLGRAGVTWPTVQRLAVTARLAGIRPLLDLGHAILEGPDEGVDAVRAVLRRLATDPAPHDALERIAQVLRQVSFEGERA